MTTVTSYWKILRKLKWWMAVAQLHTGSFETVLLPSQNQLPFFFSFFFFGKRYRSFQGKTTFYSIKGFFLCDFCVCMCVCVLLKDQPEILTYCESFSLKHQATKWLTLQQFQITIQSGLVDLRIFLSSFLNHIPYALVRPESSWKNP